MNRICLGIGMLVAVLAMGCLSPNGPGPSSDGVDTTDWISSLPQLPTGDGLMIVTPQDGDTFQYGDTMTVRFLQRVEISLEAVVAFGAANAPMTTDYNGAESELWHVFPRDNPGTPTKHYRAVPGQDGVWLGVYKLKIEDTDRVVFRDSMRIRVWDPYTNDCPQCQEGALGKGPFTIVRP